MPSSMTRAVLVSLGRASTRLWLRAVDRDTSSLRCAAARAYDTHLAALPWPQKRMLRVHLVLGVLPGAAMYTALQSQGASRAEAAQIVTDALVTMARPRRRVLRGLVASDLGRRVFMRVAAGSLRGFPEPGWEATWRERSREQVAFDITRCFDLEMLRRLDAATIAPAYCAVDDALYAHLHPRLGWARSGTLATGASCCDFRFELLSSAPAASHSDPSDGATA